MSKKMFLLAIAALAVVRPAAGQSTPTAAPRPVLPSGPALALRPQVTTLAYAGAPFGAGVLRHLATAGGTKPFQNAAEQGLVSVSASSVSTDALPPAAVVGDQVVRFATAEEPGSWVVVDLQDKRVAPSHYALRHYASWDTEALRSWVLEGSNDGQSWTLLREHRADETLKRRGDVGAWAIPSDKQGQPWRMFRVRQTGPNSNQHHRLALSGFELYGTLTVPPAVKASLSLLGQRLNVTPKSDFDPSGVLATLGTGGGTRAFENPAERGLVSVAASSVDPSSLGPSAVVGNVAARFSTAELPGSWVTVDLLARRVKPTRYALRHYASWDTEALRNWVLEGSNDGAAWTVLSTHTNDTALQKAGSTASWPIAATFHGSPFRIFRVRATGLNSNQHHRVALSGFELYGAVVEPP